MFCVLPTYILVLHFFKILTFSCYLANKDVSRHQLLLIPLYRLRTFGRRAFAVAGPTFRNSLANELRNYSSDRFKLALKTFLFATY